MLVQMVEFSGMRILKIKNETCILTLRQFRHIIRIRLVARGWKVFVGGQGGFITSSNLKNNVLRHL